MTGTSSANAVGIMQGRLSPPAAMPQAFPWGTWQREFDRARDLGFDAIEWLFAPERADENAVRHDEGRASIRQRIAESGVRVLSICAHYFVAHPFVRVSAAERQRSVDVLTGLIGEARAIGASTVLVPLLEQGEIRTEAERAEVAAALREPVALARGLEMKVGLEVELSASEYLALLEAVNHECIAVYYDVGNAAARGYDPAADVRALAKRLCGVHLKDRPRGGRSVPLGQGAVDFDAVFEALDEAQYRGPLVLEPPFGDDYLGDARRNLEFVRRVQARRGGRSE